MGHHSRLSLNSLLAVIFACTLQVLLFSDQATASPILGAWRGLVKRYSGNIAQQEPPGGYPGSPSTSNFPTDSQINAAWVPPSQNSYVFYTEINDPLGSELAYNFAREVGGVAIENTYPDQYLYVSISPTYV